MPDSPKDSEGQFAWGAQPQGPQGGSEHPSESGATYRLSGGSAPRRVATPVTPVPVVESAPRRRIASKDAGSRFALMGYNLLIFLTSVCVMTLELIASRIIGKHLGASLYTWTSVIGVILAGITLGNWLGGWLADRFDKHRALGWMYLLASIASASVLLMEQVVDHLPKPDGVSWPLWVLTVIALLFLLPAVALGATSPLIASLALSRSNRLGATVGNVYAWGACGSIVGTFLTGFYLFAWLGSRAIIGLISVSLAVLAVWITGRRKVFRAVVLCGWLQLFLFTWTAATATRESWAGALDRAALWANVASQDEAGLRRAAWIQLGGNVGQKLHELGLILGLRDDQIGRYYAESQYSYIHVADARQDGAPVKILRLDKLIHSYYNPAEPTKLHYDYEEIYAAVTKQATAARDETATVAVSDFPGWDDLRTRLPGDVSFDDASRTLSVGKLDAQRIRQLLDLAPDAGYWSAVAELSRKTCQPDWGGLEAYTLDRLPEGVAIPADLSHTVRYDEQLRLLNAYEPIMPEVQDRLIRLSPRAPWHEAVESLRRQTGQISALFIGGGGYIFPRWLAQEYPGATRIDVAELDPGVRDAAISQLGLTRDDETRIVTTIGDARQVVDDRLSANRLRAQKQQPPITYDFIYGDAFNDFSVPWHLTTREFQQKLKELLTPTGILQVNLIDVYPRAEFPGRPVAKAEVAFDNFLPKGLMPRPDFPSNQFVPAQPQFGGLQVNCLAAGKFRLRVRTLVSDRQRKLLLALDPNNSTWTRAVKQLADEATFSEPFAGEVPAAVIPAQLSPRTWVSAADGFDSLELQPTESGKFVLGFRGVMTDDARQKLLGLAPQDAAWQAAVVELQHRSQRHRAGQFLARYVYTASLVFPNIYLFGTSNVAANTHRDTFIIVCAQHPLNLQRLDRTGYWSGKPFAALETRSADSPAVSSGHMEAVLAMARNQALTDDFAPVENLLLPIFAEN